MRNRAHCARCRIPNSEKICKRAYGGRHPEFCPTVNYRELEEEVLHGYHDPAIAEFARLASVQEADCYANRGPGSYVIQPTKQGLLLLVLSLHAERRF